MGNLTTDLLKFGERFGRIHLSADPEPSLFSVQGRREGVETGRAAPKGLNMA